MNKIHFFIFDFVYNNTMINNNIAQFTNFDLFIFIQSTSCVFALRIHLHEDIAA